MGSVMFIAISVFRSNYPNFRRVFSWGPLSRRGSVALYAVALYANDLDDKLGLIVTQPQLTLWVLLALPSLVRHP